jgi:YHS domain-containing protein
MSTLSKLFKAAALAALVAMSACAPLVTQNPGAGYSPANVKNIDGAERLLLDGHDVVSYFTESTHRKGKPEINSVYKGVRVNFSSTENKAKFDQKPEAYLPQYGGFCANGVVYGIPWGGDADSWRIVDGKLYIFGGMGSKKGFELDVPGNIVLANKYWNEEINGSNALLQRTKRMVMRVPHYKSGEELAKLVAQKDAAPK